MLAFLSRRDRAYVCDCVMAQHVKTDYDWTVDFSHYKTYSWGTVHTPAPCVVDRISVDNFSTYSERLDGS